MSRDLSRLSIRELRRRFLLEKEDVSPRLLARLRRDPRRGVRALHDALRKRHRQFRSEQARLDAMLHFEHLLWAAGTVRIAGVDEAGMGPLAGPVVAAAVVFPPDTRIEGIDDSKRLDAARREELAGIIREQAAGLGVGRAEVAEIDDLNIYHAGKLAMRRAVEGLPEPPQHVLCDAREIPGLPMPQNTFDRGDGLNFSIAAASIIAKVVRDAAMVELDARYPGYGFARHKGYGTAEHQEAIRKRGPCEVHRKSFTFLRELCGEYSRRFYEWQTELAGASTARQLSALEGRLAAERDRLPPEEHRKLRLVISRRWKILDR